MGTGLWAEGLIGGLLGDLEPQHSHLMLRTLMLRREVVPRSESPKRPTRKLVLDWT